MTESTERFALPFILPGQAQKETFHNEALTAVDLLLHTVVQEGPLDTPPEVPEPGQCWIVGPDPTGDWAGKPASIALWTTSGWRYAAPVLAQPVWSSADGHCLYWDGTNWTSPLAVHSIAIGGVQVVGVRQPSIATPSGGTVIDAEARASLAQVIAALMTHGLIE